MLRKMTLNSQPYLNKYNINSIRLGFALQSVRRFSGEIDDTISKLDRLSGTKFPSLPSLDMDTLDTWPL